MSGAIDILLHIGMQKAGSTALQHRFAGLRDWLDARGLHYPQGLQTEHNHSLLVALGSRGQRLPRHYETAYRGDVAAAAAAVEGWFDGVLATARARGARRILLSAETLFRLETAEAVAPVARVLRRAGGRLVVLAYLRAPADYYAAQVQQRLKAGHVLIRPGPVPYRPPLTAWEGVADEIRVRRYDRALFPDRDIARAVQEEIGADPVPLPEGAGTPERNASIGAEGMALMQDYRAAIHPRANRKHRPDSAALLRAIGRAEARLGLSGPPRLHPELADRLDHGAPDLTWLKARFGIAFPGIDYDRIAPAEDGQAKDGRTKDGRAEAGPAGTWPVVRRVADICPLDPERARRLTLETMAELARGAGGAELARSAGGAELARAGGTQPPASRRPRATEAQTPPQTSPQTPTATAARSPGRPPTARGPR